jgi:S1-C subfamily serine protease
MSAQRDAPVISDAVDPDDLEDDGPVFAWLPPDDRLWRHPSELQTSPLRRPGRGSALREIEHRIWAVALLAGTVGALVASGVGVATGGFHRSTTVVRPIERVVDPLAGPQVTLASNAEDTGVVGIAARLRPAIVELQVKGSKGEVSGSGVIFRSDGYVLTNAHVVEGASSITAILADGHQVSARLVGADPETDIAVVKVSGPSRPIATLGTASTLRVGQTAVAIGSPLGLPGGPSVTVGVVSALGREVDSNGGPPLLDMIQTDAPIAEGSSGGALVDRDGSVIGITTATAVGVSGPQGLGFATPIDIARTVADQLITTGHVTHVWLGVEGEDVDSDTAGRLGITGGAAVDKVASGSPAAAVGIAASDVIIGVDGTPIASIGGLVVAMRDRRPGDRVTISYLRGTKSRTAQVVLIERPSNPSP